MEIAVFLNDDRDILPFSSSGIVEIYKKEQFNWHCVNQIPFDLSFQKDLREFQTTVKLLTSEFENCKLLIVENVKSLPLALLRESGIGIWKAEGKFTPRLADFVTTKLENAMKYQEKEIVRPKLVGNKEDAMYFIDLIPLLHGDRRLNSIDILIPFIKDTNFKTLQIICSHLPKWFNYAVEVFRLSCSKQQLETDVWQVTLHPLIWVEDISFRKDILIHGVNGGCSGC